ncbi:MAG: hypothetical protein ACKVU4_01505 [Phycisphaerales bacterium]
MRSSGARVLALAFVLLAASIAGEPAAHAQRIRNEAGPLVTPIARTAIDDYAAILTLDPEQKTLARSLYDGYRAAMRQAGKDAEEKIKAIEEGVRHENDAVMGDFRELKRKTTDVVRGYVARTEGVEREFYGDLKAVLTPAQAERFGAVERARRREVGLRLHLLSGEGVDLTRVAADLKLGAPAPPDLAPALAEYEAELDRLLRGKIASLGRLFEAAQKMEELDPEREPGPPKAMIDAVTEFHAECTKVRDANRTHARRIAALLPPPSGTAFSEKFRERSYPKIYRETAADKTIAFARGLADLSGDQRAELDAVADSFARESAMLNQKWAAALDEMQEKLVEEFTKMFSGEGRRDENDPLKLACEARRDLDERTKGRIARIFTATQIERLGEKKIMASEFDPDWEPDFDEDKGWEDWDDDDDGK